MALKTLSKTNILNGNVVQAADISQSIDAFTGIEGYAISLSGSFTFSGATTGSGFFQNAVNALSGSSVYIASNASTNTNYTLVFKNDSLGLDGFHPLAADGTNGPYYNPSTNVLGGAGGGLTISGSVGNFNTITGSLSGSVNGTASFAVSASYALTSSFATTASYATTAPSPIAIEGASYPIGSPSVPSALFRFIAGADITGNPTPTVNVTINEILGKTLGQDCFVTTTVTGSAVASVVVNSLIGNILTFSSTTPNTEFHYHIMYI